MSTFTPCLPSLNTTPLQDAGELERTANLLRDHPEKFPGFPNLESLLPNFDGFCISWREESKPELQVVIVRLTSGHVLVESENGTFHVCEESDMDDLIVLPLPLFAPVWKSK